MAVPEFSIVVPVYNEAENILPLIRGIEKEVPGNYELLIVYDFDADTTVPVVKALNPPMPRLRLVKNNLGKGVVNAIRAGFADSRGLLGVVVTMADLSDPPDKIFELVKSMRAGNDVVAGSRYMAGGSQTGGPKLKGFLSRLAGTLAYYLTGIGIHDVTTNFRAYSARLVREVPIESQGGFELGLELTVKCHLKGWRVGEVPSSWQDRTAGESRFRLFKWLPGYLRWYLKLLRGDLFGWSGKIRRARMALPQPGSYSYFGVYQKPGYGWLAHRFLDATIIVALTEHQKIVMVRQSRPSDPHGSAHWELPGGAVDQGEWIVTGAKRELLEESSYETTEEGIILASHTQPAPGMSVYPHHIVLLTGCRPTSGVSAHRDEGISQVAEFTLAETRELIRRGEINALPTLAALNVFQATVEK